VLHPLGFKPPGRLRHLNPRQP